MKEPKELIKISRARLVFTIISVAAATIAWGVAAALSLAAALMVVMCIVAEIAIITKEHEK